MCDPWGRLRFCPRRERGAPEAGEEDTGDGKGCCVVRAWEWAPERRMRRRWTLWWRRKKGWKLWQSRRIIYLGFTLRTAADLQKPSTSAQIKAAFVNYEFSMFLACYTPTITIWTVAEFEINRRWSSIFKQMCQLPANKSSYLCSLII